MSDRVTSCQAVQLVYKYNTVANEDYHSRCLSVQ